MGIKGYLTIDDTPSGKTDELIGFLSARDIPAILFVRGDSMDNDPLSAIKAIGKGFILGNHNYSHKRASNMSYENCVAEIDKTEELIEKAYQEAGIKRQGKYFRFPHMDRGCGGWVVNYDAYPMYKDKLLSLFADGLNVSLDKPSDEDLAKKQMLQNYLRNEGFTSPYKNIGFDWYDNTEMAQAVDAMFTYSTSDWMLNQRHLEKDWPYKTVEDLNAKFDKEVANDPASYHGTHIILAHDHAEISTKILAIIQHMLDKDVEFLPV